MPEMHLRQPRFMYSACGLFTKNEGRIQKFKETGDLRNIYQKEVGKTCFQHNMAYGAYKDLPRRMTSDQLFSNKVFAVSSNLNYDRYQRGLA